MAKKKAKQQQTSRDGNAKVDQPNTTEQKRTWHLREIEAIVLQMREDGETPEKIVTFLNRKGITEYQNGQKKPVKIQKATVSNITNQAINTGRFRYFPELCGELERRIAQFNPTLRLDNINVVQTAHGKHIATRGADEFLRILQLHKEKDASNNDEIRVGFFGGKTPSDLMLVLAKRFSEMKSAKETECYPKKITFISLVGSFPTSKIAVDPNAYFTFFPMTMPDEHDYFDFRFVSLPVTGLLTPTEHKSISKFKVVVEAMAERQNLDVIVGACGHWGSGHHSSYDYVSSACGEASLALWEQTNKKLRSENVIGDFCWSPINADGPIAREKLPLRLFTALDFDQIVDFVHPKKRRDKADGKLLLLVSPCYSSDCTQISKGEVLEAILHANSLPPVTHLVADSASAREYCDRFLATNRPVSQQDFPL